MKQYIKPELLVVELETEGMIADSDPNFNWDPGTGNSIGIIEESNSSDIDDDDIG